MSEVRVVPDVTEAIAESVGYYADEVERWRNIFLGVLGHDLRSPLTAIVGWTDLFEEQTLVPLAIRLPVGSANRGDPQSSQYSATYSSFAAASTSGAWAAFRPAHPPV